MLYLMQIVLGVFLALGSIAFGRKIKRENLVFGLGLLLVSVWYLGWGVWGGYSLEILLPQIAGGVGFGICAIFGLRGAAILIGVGWMIHGVWDLASPLFSDVSYMPAWTTPLCLGYDLLLGGYVIAMSMKKPEEEALSLES